MSSFVATPFSNVMMAFTLSIHVTHDRWVHAHLVDEWHEYSVRNETGYVLRYRELCSVVAWLLTFRDNERDNRDVTLSASDGVSFGSFER